MTAQRKAAQAVSRSREARDSRGGQDRSRETGKRAASAVASSTAAVAGAGAAAARAVSRDGGALPGTGKDASQQEAPAAQRAVRLRRIQERALIGKPAPERAAAPEPFDDEAENRRGRDMIFDDDVVEERRYRNPDEAAEAE